MSVSWGFLSTAFINDWVLDELQGCDEVDVVAVASRDAAKAEKYAKERGIERAHASYEALLEDPDVEAVYVPLPNSMHTEWTLRALEAGKHVLVEKPFTSRGEDVERVFELARKKDLLVMEAFMYRHNPQTLALARLIDEGAIGTLQTINSTWRVRNDDPDSIRFVPALEGGSLGDVGSYCVSITRLLAGEPEQVYAEQVLGETGVPLRFFGVLRFPGGVVGHFDDAITSPMRGMIEVSGDLGWLTITDPFLCKTPGIELHREDEVERIAVESGKSYRLEFENLSAAIRGKEEPRLGYEDALGQARTMEALTRSATEGRPVRLDQI
jgi:xylose dehydrogenase (NAD/NADP)